MEKIIKHSTIHSGGFIPGPVWLIGTQNEDGSHNLSTITWVSYLAGPPECMIVSMQARKTKENILRTKEFTANLCNTGMARLADYVGMFSGKDTQKDAVPYDYSWGEKVQAPVLDASPCVIECTVVKTDVIGDTHVFIAQIVNQQIDAQFGRPDDDSGEAYIRWLNANDIHNVDPLLYTWKYYRIGEKIGNLGELYVKPD